MKKILILLVTIATLAFAGDVSRKGTTGAEQLLIPVGARSIATAGAFLSNVTGVEAIYYNPAGLDVAKRTEAIFSFMSYIADINVSYFAAGTHLGDFGSVALSYKGFDFGDIPVTTNDAPDGTGATYTPGFFTMGLTYSKIITDRVTAGVTINMIHEGIMNTSANGVAADFGVQYRFPEHLSLGVAVKNIGSNMRYSGQDLQQKTSVPNANINSKLASFEAVTEDFEIPSYFEMSVAYDMNLDEDNGVLVGSTFRNNNSMEDQLKVGLEYGFKKMFFVRAGYDMLTTNNSESIYGLCLGAGFQYTLSEGMQISLDYAYRQVKNFPKDNHVFTLKLGLD
ncbi:MAG: PorV/PorQ family protein [Ignavibacteria bacterium]|nr:PorV/PorQ family protein [Ignavibacteria bacterium]